MSDADLLNRAVDGDRDALTTLLRRHGPSVRGSLRIESTWQAVLEADDVMQVTCLEAFMSIHHFDSTRYTSFEAWLRRIAENNLKDAVRGLMRQKRPQPRDRVRQADNEDSVAGLAELLGVTLTTPSQRARRDEARAALLDAIDALPKDYATVIRLYDLHGQSVEETAKALGRSQGAVFMLRARALERLRGLLGTGSIFFSTVA
jgi:RNA polymerase sigma-70 factor (ECF subfamily)